MGKKPVYHVLDLTPRHDQASKPEELIQIKGHQSLSLNARRAITLLWHNAHRQGIQEGKDYTIAIRDLVPTGHKGSDVVEEAVVSLMQTLITVRRTDGSTTRVQFLGGNDMDSPDRPAGVLTYSFDKRLIAILQNSTIWGKISLPVLVALSSKYGISLYEHLAQWSGLDNKIYAKVTVEELREIIGIEDGKYPRFSEINRHILRPVIQELNALASFGVAVTPVKTGRKITHVRIHWWRKDVPELRKAWEELQRSRAGRKARILNQDDSILE